jgi:hypothetical protein
VYCVDKEVWNDPIRLAVIESVGRKFLDWFESDKSKVAWFEPTPQNSPQIASNLELEPVSATVRTPPITYKHGGVRTPSETQVEDTQDIVCQTTEEVAEVSTAVVQKSELEELIDFLPLAQTPEDFASIIEGSPLETVEEAIALSGDQPRRRQLTEWLKVLDHPVSEVESQPLKPRSWQWSELPAVKSVLRWIDRPEQVRVLEIDSDGFCQVRSLLSGLITNSHCSQLMPASR